MSSSRLDKPTPETVRTVALLAGGFSALAIVAQLFYVAVLQPLLPQSFEVDFSARALTSHIMATPSGLAAVGWVFVVLGAAAAITAVLLSRSGARGAYACGVLACIVMPGFVGSLLGNAYAAMDGDGGLSFAVIALIAGVAVGGFAIFFAFKLTGQRTSD
jgi:hypothetical protein